MVLLFDVVLYGWMILCCQCGCFSKISCCVGLVLYVWSLLFLLLLLLFRFVWGGGCYVVNDVMFVADYGLIVVVLLDSHTPVVKPQ